MSITDNATNVTGYVYENLARDVATSITNAYLVDKISKDSKIDKTTAEIYRQAVTNTTIGLISKKNIKNLVVARSGSALRAQSYLYTGIDQIVNKKTFYFVTPKIEGRIFSVALKLSTLEPYIKIDIEDILGYPENIVINTYVLLCNRLECFLQPLEYTLTIGAKNPLSQIEILPQRADVQSAITASQLFAYNETKSDEHEQDIDSYVLGQETEEEAKAYKGQITRIIKDEPKKTNTTNKNTRGDL